MRKVWLLAAACVVTAGGGGSLSAESPGVEQRLDALNQSVLVVLY
jgi:hypothetical protein